jgi:predicted small lipoprotein YifL
MTMLRQFRIAIATLMLLAAAGCGIKGPLVLPPPAPAAAAVPATPPATTTPPAADPAPSKPAAAERKP